MNTNLDTRILELEKTLEKTFTTGAKFSTGDVASNSLIIQLK